MRSPAPAGSPTQTSYPFSDHQPGAKLPHLSKVRLLTVKLFRVIVQWVHRLRSGLDETIRDFRAAQSTRPAYSENYILPNADKSNL